MEQANTFNFIKGHKDDTGHLHTDFDLRIINGADEEAISVPNIKMNGAKVIRTLLERCCTRIGTIYKSDTPNKEWTEIIQGLDVGDQDVMLLRLREISMGNELETHYTCPDKECKTKIDLFIEVDEIPVKEWTGKDFIEFDLPHGGKLKDGSIAKKGRMRFPNGLDREMLDTVIRKNVGKANTSLLTRVVMDVEGQKVTDAFIRDLSTKDRQYLMQLIKDEGFGLDLKVEVECPNCGETFTASLNVVNFI